MADTSIKVDERVRDRLAQLARERGATIRDLVAELAGTLLTREEQDARYAAAHARITEHLCPDLTEGDVAIGQWAWDELQAGRVPASLTPPAEVLAEIRAEVAEAGDRAPRQGSSGRQADESRRAG